MHGIPACPSDEADWPFWDMVTSDLMYVRLHGHELTYASGYPDARLRELARKLRSWNAEGRDVHLYFGNDACGDAPRKAQRLIRLVGEKR